MRKLLLLTTLLASPAFSADLPLKAPLNSPSPFIVDYWTGFYAGFNAGYGWAPQGFQAFDVVPLAELSASPQGFVGGVHAGYGGKIANNFYLGIEGDGDLATIDGTGSAPGFVSATSKNNFLASIRGRFGFIITPNVLLYGTAGYGFGSGQFTVTDVATGFATAVSPTRGGLAWGGGLEFALPQTNWLARAEYLQYDFADMSVAAGPAIFTAKDRVDVVRGGLSYKF